MFQNIKEIWLTISLKRKIGSFAVMVILVMGLSVAFNIRIMDFSLGSFNIIHGVTISRRRWNWK